MYNILLYYNYHYCFSIDIVLVKFILHSEGQILSIYDHFHVVQRSKRGSNIILNEARASMSA